MAAKKIINKKKKYPKLSTGILHIHTSSNNTIATFTDIHGNVINGMGAGAVGFKGAKESSAYAAEVLVKKLVTDIRDNCGLKELTIKFKGIGLARDGVFKAVNQIGGLEITSIIEATSLQFGGCKGIRPKRN